MLNLHKYGFFMLVIIGLQLFFACKKEVPDYVSEKYDAELIPSIDTDSVTTRITDSGRVRYKIVAERMQIFDRAKTPYWFFPKGLYLEQYDSLFKVNATIDADTAWNYTSTSTWRLKGNVMIKNMVGSIFKTEELFWNQQTEKIYTDKFVTIITPDRKLKGYGLDASQDLTRFQIRRPTGFMQVEDKDM